VIFSKLFHQLPKAKRQKSLRLKFGFDCSCEACENDFPLAHELTKLNLQPESDSTKAKIFLNNCLFIESNFRHYPSFELCKAMNSNLSLLQQMATEMDKQAYTSVP